MDKNTMKQIERIINKHYVTRGGTVSGMAHRTIALAEISKLLSATKILAQAQERGIQ